MKAQKVFLLAALVSLVSYSVPMAQERGTEKLGTVDLPVSCTPAAQQEFNRAVALLHSFWFDAAAQGFAAVTKTDPGCGMGYWGEAMATLFAPNPFVGTPTKGLGANRVAIASPQYPIPQPGSVLVTAAKPWAAASNQKECNRATARLNSCWAAGVHDTGRSTVPSFSVPRSCAIGTE